VYDVAVARSTDTLVKTPTAITAISATITRVTTSAKPRREVGAIDINRLGGSGEPPLAEGRTKKRIRQIRVIGDSIMKRLPARKVFIGN
jgi:hypothetical protein